MITAIANHKGGVGKTSVACNLGAIMAIKGFRVLVVDNDPQANASGILLPRETRMEKSLYELLDPTKASPPLEECIYPTHHKDLYVLPNVEDTSGLELDFVQAYPDSLGTLRRAIRPASRERFDLILIDNPPTLSVFVAQALHAADCVLVPVDAGSSFSMAGLQNVLNLIASIQQNGNPDLRFLKMLINRVDRRTAIAPAVVENLRSRFGDDMIFKTEIAINTDMQKAEYLKDTIFRSFPHSRGARHYRALSAEMAEIVRGAK